MAIAPKSAITLAELQVSPEFLACTPKMRCWLVRLIESNFDYTAATVRAFECHNPRNSQIFSFAIRRWPKIRACLDLYLGRDERESFLADLKETIRREKGIAKVRAQALYARMAFGVSEGPTDLAETETAPSAVSDTRIPVGATALVDERGVTRGYRTADGQYIQLAAVEATR
jgi:hypothetical protein